jgi:hypothetical protein
MIPVGLEPCKRRMRGLRSRGFAFTAGTSKRQAATHCATTFFRWILSLVLVRLNAAEFLGSESYTTREIEERGGSGTHGQRFLDHGLSSGRPARILYRRIASLAETINIRSASKEEPTGKEALPVATNPSKPRTHERGPRYSRRSVGWRTPLRCAFSAVILTLADLKALRQPNFSHLLTRHCS